MAISPTPRFGLKQFSTGSDPHPTRLEHNAMIALIEANSAIFSQGTLSARPTAGKPGRYYWATDAKRSYYDDGQAWAEISPIGGGGAGKALVVGGQSSEGTSDRAARADHTHAVPLATSAVDGAMSKADKAKLDKATTSATADTIAVRDAAGALNVATPTGAAHATTKAYVDGRIQEAATYAEDLVDEIPFASATDYGHMIPADKIKLDAATHVDTPNTLARRGSAGEINVGATTGAANAARKDYVDAEVAKKANASHSHAAADLPTVSQTAPGIMTAADKTKLDRASSAATANTIMQADANGRFQSAAPSAAADVANKGYVDGEAAKKANTSHTHAGSDINSGTISPDRIANATSALDGLMSQTDKAKLDAATSANTPGALIQRATNGQVTFPDPTSASHVANKAYVDAEVATRAPSSHNHSGAQITSGTVPAARLPLATSAANGAMSAADKAKLDAASNIATPGSLMAADSAGRYRASNPSNSADVANKGYVDGADQATMAIVESRGAKSYSNREFKEPASSGGVASFELASITIPDPGWPYHILANATVEAAGGTSSATRWDLGLYINGAVVDTARGDAVAPWYKLNGATYSAGRGAGSTITIKATKMFGSTAFGVSNYNRFFSVLVIPAGE